MKRSKVPSLELHNIKGKKNERLIAERKRRNLTQKQLAELIGVSASRIGQLEQGRSTPSLEVALTLQELFGVSEDILFKNY